MSLDSQVQLILQDAGYRTWLEKADNTVAICFEDEVNMGFASILETPRALLDRWQAIESSLLIRHAARLRRAGEKAWNVYSVFLCSESGEEQVQRDVRRLEEDLERTRKIAACGVIAREHVVLALLPILPIQYRPILDRQNAEERLRNRIAQLAPGAVSAVLNKQVEARSVVPLLRPAR